MNLADLRKPFPPEKISWRIGSTNSEKTSGLALAYIDSRDVQDRLDAVCGVENWQSRYPHANGKTVCEIGIRINNEWIWKADGAGDTDVEAEKGALSDAFKRAAVRWGVGRYLYDLDSPWVRLVAAGRSYKIAPDEYARLRKILGGEKDTNKPQSQDVQDGVKNWCDQQRALIDACKYEGQLYEWKKKADANLAKLSQKSSAAFDDLMAHYQEKVDSLTQKENA